MKEPASGRQSLGRDDATLLPPAEAPPAPEIVATAAPENPIAPRELETAAPDPFASAFTEPAYCPVAPRVEGYRLLRPLGEGAMGVVWLAIQEGTQRQVALKLMAAAYTGSAVAQARFGREVEIAATLEHPNIARVYDGAARGHLVYCAMELIEGVALDIHARQTQLGDEATLVLLARIARAVQFAHSRGIIHRDLKPSNIMVCPDGTPKLLDFGLARAMDAPELTATGGIAGTPAYMSPEQARGENKTLDVRTDVYSLGVILYQLLTGALPHKADGGSTFDLLRRVSITDAPPARRDRPDIDVEIEAILARALARDRDGRYASAADFADDVDAYLAGRPVKARPQTRLYLGTKWAIRHKVSLSIAAAIAITVVGATATYIVRITAEQARTHAAKVDADRSRDAAVGKVEVISDRLATSVRTLNAITTAASVVATALPGDGTEKLLPLIDAVSGGLHAISVLPPSGDALDASTAEAVANAADLLWEMHRDADATERYRDALNMLDTLVGKVQSSAPPQAVQALVTQSNGVRVRLARCLLSQGLLTDARAQLSRVSHDNHEGASLPDGAVQLMNAELLHARGELLPARQAYEALASRPLSAASELRRRLRYLQLLRASEPQDVQAIVEARSRAVQSVEQFRARHGGRRLPRMIDDGLGQALADVLETPQQD